MNLLDLIFFFLKKSEETHHNILSHNLLFKKRKKHTITQLYDLMDKKKTQLYDPKENTHLTDWSDTCFKMLIFSTI